MNPFYHNNGFSPRQMVQQRLQQSGIQLPAEIMNDPNAIIQQLLQSGRISQDQVNRAYQTAQRFR